jgi:hypothetical protein
MAYPCLWSDAPSLADSKVVLIYTAVAGEQGLLAGEAKRGEIKELAAWIVMDCDEEDARGSRHSFG